MRVVCDGDFIGIGNVWSIDFVMEYLVPPEEWKSKWRVDLLIEHRRLWTWGLKCQEMLFHLCWMLYVKEEYWKHWKDILKYRRMCALILEVITCYPGSTTAKKMANRAPGLTKWYVCCFWENLTSLLTGMKGCIWNKTEWI